MNRIGRNLVWLLFAQAATWIVSIALLLVAPRVLGDTEFGQLSFVIVYASFVDLLANMGTNTFLVKAIARDTTSTGRYVANAVVMKLILATCLSALALGLAVALHLDSTTIVLIAAYCVGAIINAVGTTIGAGLTGLQLMSGIARWNMLQCYVGGLGGVLVLMTGGSVITYAIVFNLAFLIPIPGNYLKLRHYMGPDRAIEVRSWKEILRGGFPFFILAALLVLYGTIDIPLLQAMSGSEEVGWYALAYRWVSVPAFFAATVASAFFPALSAEGVHLAPLFSSLANRALRLVVVVATPAAIGIALVAAPFLTLLYGGQYDHAIPLLRILALHIPIVGLDIILGSVAMASDRQRQWVAVSAAATLFNPLMNLVAIPLTARMFGNAAIGAAIVTVMTELILMAGGIALRPQGVLDRPTLNSLVRIVGASLTMVPVVLLLSSTPLVVQVVAGMITYAVASLALRAVSIDEIKGWTSALRRGSRGEVSAATAISIEEASTL